MAKSTTTRAKSTATKTTAKKRTTTKAAPKPATRAAVAAAAAPAEPANLALKKRELINTVSERSGIKKKDARPVVEAMLEVLGESLAEGRELNLLPFGKAKVRKSKMTGNGRMFIMRIRQKTIAVHDGKDTVAEAAE